MRVKLLFALMWLCCTTTWGTPHNIALKAHVTASSVLNEQSKASLVTDQIIRVSNKGEWVSNSKLDARGRVYPFPWIQLDWDSAMYTNKIILYDRADENTHTAAGTLHFSDGSSIIVNTIPNDGSPKVVEFETKKVSWVRFEVTDGEGKNLGLSEIEVYPAPESYEDYVSWVNPFIETAKGRYFFFVTGSTPFGMIGSAPLTRNINQGGGGYNYNSTRLLGFPQIHNWMISGLTLMPVSGDVDTSKGEMGWNSNFSHDGEIAQPGYHRLYLDKYNIWSEQTITDRVGFYRFTYTQDALAKILINLGGHVATSTMINAKALKVTDTEISGYFDTAGRVWGGVDKAKVYFIVRFEKPFKVLNSWNGNQRQSDIREMKGASELISVPGSSFKQSPTSGVEVDFGKLEAGGQILLKTSISYVSIENARENMDQECMHWDFDKVRRTSCDLWNEWLGKIDVSGGENNQKIKFYTDLWHVLLGRHKIDDYNGQYPDYLTGGKRIGTQTRIHTIDPEFHVRTLPKHPNGRPKHHMYNSDALWLTQWNLNTLWGLAYPSVLDDFAASLIEYDKNGGLLPRGPSAGAYTYIMTGCPATSLITSAYQRGLTHKWSPSAGYKAMKRNHDKGGMLAFDMDKELAFYIQNGYCPDNAGLTIQWSFEDWALGQMAKAMGKQKDYHYYHKRASGWSNSFHKTIGLIMPKKENGEWSHTNPQSEKGFVQANAWQATFGLSHDLKGLANQMGGNDSLAFKLNFAFEKSVASDFLFGYISYANQPGCSNAHVFSHVGKPWLSQYWTRRVGRQTYGAITPESGYSGNDEDQGQMASISALMAMGLFSINGGSAFHPSYDITAPVFDEIVISLDPDYYEGTDFRIKTYNNSVQNTFIQKASLNGKEHNDFQFSHEVYRKGGILELWLGDTPNKSWGVHSDKKAID